MNKNKAKRKHPNSNDKSQLSKNEGKEWSKYSRTQVNLFRKKTVWIVNVVSNIVRQTLKKVRREQ